MGLFCDLWDLQGLDAGVTWVEGAGAPIGSQARTTLHGHIAYHQTTQEGKNHVEKVADVGLH